MMWEMDGWMGFGWGWGLHWLLPLVIIGLLVWVLTGHLRDPERARGMGRGSGGKALEILKERYARGELTRDEYEQMRQDIAG